MPTMTMTTTTLRTTIKAATKTLTVLLSAHLKRLCGLLYAVKRSCQLLDFFKCYKYHALGGLKGTNWPDNLL